MRIKKHQAQTTLEYAILIIIILGAFVAVSTYVKRGIQGNWKESVDNLGEQYDPTLMNTHINHTITSDAVSWITTSNATVNGEDGIVTTRIDSSNSVERTRGSSAVAGE
ncbi:MAG: hypothetical protein WC676_01465 [Candidatus Omnitrophota bacterium]